MFKKSMWYSILVIAFVGFVILANGFYQAILVTTQANPQPTSESSPLESATDLTPSSKNPNTIQILILGDSVAKGTGDEKSKGFSGYLTEYLKNNTSKEIISDNMGIDGLESTGLLEQLQSHRLEQQLTHTDIILVSIGGNDIRSILTLNSFDKENEFKVRLDRYLSNLKLTFKELRRTNPNSIIIFLGLYNPYEKATNLVDSQLLNSWNFNTQQLVETDSKAIFIPTYDLFKYNTGKFVAQDGLHPNSAGYQAISNRISRSLEMIIAGL
ncbi:GDSL-type esterase/lipase family protein [Desulfosporosinus meridiei]|uniref:Lysophospholipase L1-like esterase n=1 Tax=Desulfosporosinus meridiei (strain ATCC BAA-275 / DSM 13257 / KCTC 12902 / NCIMB 13706 / S10) TaxID=768704 RepID=J7IY22_DESMD|nr:GDSL-type esterase/lipase family protein [Desulfosporosinus meridiei]AFQ45034.1 lysophospholipase L1-like esterase [Desulfosporosinus meridiei DSM 13257]